MKKTKLKLYVWEDVLRDYTDGIAFALAESPERARMLIWEKLGYQVDDIMKEPDKVVDEPEGFYCYGGG